jgi:hypothetical protein
MPQPPSDPTSTVPRWLVILGSVAIMVHLLAVTTVVLAAPSGPWVTPEGPALSTPPPFALSLNRVATPAYLQWVKLTHPYRFASNRSDVPAVIFEVNLKDDAGRPMATFKLPDPKANYWVRHRQSQLAGGLAPDQLVQPRPGEVLPAPNQKIETVSIWEGGPDRNLRLREVPEHLVPRDRQVWRPSEWSMLLAESYVRYLCRAHGAASGELVRRTRQPVHPALLFMPEPPPGEFEDLIAHFGEFHR